MSPKCVKLYVKRWMYLKEWLDKSSVAFIREQNWCNEKSLNTYRERATQSWKLNDCLCRIRTVWEYLYNLHKRLMYSKKYYSDITVPSQLWLRIYWQLTCMEIGILCVDKINYFTYCKIFLIYCFYYILVSSLQTHFRSIIMKCWRLTLFSIKR